MKQVLLFAAIFSLFSGSVLAVTNKPVKADHPPSQTFFSDVAYTGYFDTSYNYLVRSNQFTSGANNRLYDIEQNGFTLQQASVIVSKQPLQGFGWYINPVIGRDANSLAPYGWDPYYGSQTIGFIIPQAYLQFSTGLFEIIAGCFSPLVGAEYYNPTLDANFSRSILDGYAEPGVMLGVRTSYTINKLKLYAGVNDGWDTIRDTSRSKTIELGSKYTFNSAYSLEAYIYTGMERLVNYVDSGPVGRRNLFNVIAEMKATEYLAFALSGDYGMQTKAGLPDGSQSRAAWKGVSAYINYQLGEKWRTSLRGEIYDDQNAYTTGVRQNWRELTLTLAYVPVKNIELRAETRHDFSNVNSFVNINGVGVSNNQQSFAIEGLYKI